uniref:Globin domain-containing protein n=1 Tax=Scylla olivacea TaxID=85551 RepID=A0A0P4W6P2_SCYOL
MILLISSLLHPPYHLQTSPVLTTHLYSRLFENHSELITLFTKFRQLRTRDEQAESLELAEHATMVMNSIDEGIKAMDNVDFFFGLLHQIGASHRKIPGFKKEYFWVR